MTTATLIPTMRTVTTMEDSFLADAFLDEYIGDDPWKLDDLIPGYRGDHTFHPIAIAVDGSAAEFEVYPGTEWDVEKTEKPLGRIIFRR